MAEVEGKPAELTTGEVLAASRLALAVQKAAAISGGMLTPGAGDVLSP